MDKEYFEIEPIKPFSESLIWQLNRDFYQERGLAAWSENIVPHHMTSNSMVGKTYAELIFSFLKDLASKGKVTDTVYILELGAGHGRLAFHILKHLENLTRSINTETPPYCYVLSDIVEDNLTFFRQHPQFQTYLENGLLDTTYFDATKSKELFLRHAQKKISPKGLNQPLLIIANYFFDSIPTDLFLIRDKMISTCSVTLQSTEDPTEMRAEKLISKIKLNYFKEPINPPFYVDPLINEILEDYKTLVFDTYLFFPKKSLNCLANLKELSTEGMMLLSMDKGFHDIHDLDKKDEPEIIAHGSFSFWVNFHAISSFCEKQGGKALFPSFSNFHLDIGCLLFLADSETFVQTDAAYQQFVNNFGPDDFNTIKRLAYANVSKLKIKDLIALVRLSAYDSTIFIKLLPRIRQVSGAITFNERRRLEQTLHQVWAMYFSINESFDLAYEIGGVFYDLGFYEAALNQYEYSINLFGQKVDIYYNKILCYYQLRKDPLFLKTLDEAKLAFPNNEMLAKLDKLDMTSS